MDEHEWGCPLTIWRLQDCVERFDYIKEYNIHCTDIRESNVKMKVNLNLETTREDHNQILQNVSHPRDTIDLHISKCELDKYN